MKISAILRISLLLALPGLLLSCQKEVFVDFPDQKPQIVINSLFTPDSLFTVRVFGTLPLLDARSHEVLDNATVVIYENEAEVETLPYNAEKEYYRSNSFKPTAGRVYRVRVAVPGYPDATAQSSVPLAVPIANFVYKDSAGVDENGSFINSVTYTFEDPAQENNFYAMQGTFDFIQVRPNFGTAKFDTIRGFSSLYLYSDQPTVKTSAYAGGLAMVDDQLFDGQTQSIALSFYPGWYDPRRNSKRTFRFYLKTASSEYFRYFQKLQGHLTNQNFDIFAGEAVIMYTNVENGYGVFAGYSQDTVVVVK
jgi:hypothetical protein